MLEKIEKLTLYILQLEERIKQLEKLNINGNLVNIQEIDSFTNYFGNKEDYFGEEHRFLHFFQAISNLDTLWVC